MASDINVRTLAPAQPWPQRWPQPLSYPYSCAPVPPRLPLHHYAYPDSEQVRASSSSRSSHTSTAGLRLRPRAAPPLPGRQQRQRAAVSVSPPTGSQRRRPQRRGRRASQLPRRWSRGAASGAHAMLRTSSAPSLCPMAGTHCHTMSRPLQTLNSLPSPHPLHPLTFPHHTPYMQERHALPPPADPAALGASRAGTGRAGAAIDV